jgi:hypothetical protein
MFSIGTESSHLSTVHDDSAPRAAIWSFFGTHFWLDFGRYPAPYFPVDPDNLRSSASQLLFPISVKRPTPNWASKNGWVGHWALEKFCVGRPIKCLWSFWKISKN